MTRKYVIECIEPRGNTSFIDWLRARKRVRLIRKEDGHLFKVLLSTRETWGRGDVIAIEDDQLLSAPQLN